MCSHADRGCRLVGRLNRLRGSEFLRNVTILASGTAVAQCVTVVATPLLTRLYLPSDFGVLALLLAIVAPPAMIAGLRYELAIVLPKREDEAANLFLLTAAIVVAFSILSLIVVLLWSQAIADALGEPSLAPLVWLLPVAVVLAGFQGAAEGWITRRKAFSLLSASSVLRSLTTIALQVGGGLIGGGAKVLFLSRVVGSAIVTAIVVQRLVYRDGRRIRAAASLLSMKTMACLHWRFVAFNVPSTVLNAISGTAPVLLLTYYFDAVAAGLFFLCYRLLEMPRDLIGTAVRRVFFQRAADEHNHGRNLRPTFVKLTVALLAVALGPAVVLAALGPMLFALVFGPEWERAGAYAQWLIIPWATAFCTVPAVTLFFVLKLQAASLAIEVIAILLRVGAVALGAKLGDDMTAIALFAMAGVIINLTIIALVFWHTRERHAVVSV